MLPLARRIAIAAFVAIAPLIPSALGQQFDKVELETGPSGKGKFSGLLLKPDGPGPFPAIVAMHGCGGLITAKGAIAAREKDWAERLVRQGYAVLLTDSFNARGFRQLCTSHHRQIVPKDRAEDAAAAARWLARQAWADPSRLALMGWSHGAMSVLWTVRPSFMTGPVRYRTAIAFYPGCRLVLREPGWKATVPLTLLLGAADDWTQPGPCRELAEKGGARMVEYPNAYHGFDAPRSPVRVRTGLATVKSGRAHVGTNPEARAAALKEVDRILAAAFTGSTSGPPRK